MVAAVQCPLGLAKGRMCGSQAATASLRCKYTFHKLAYHIHLMSIYFDFSSFETLVRDKRLSGPFCGFRDIYAQHITQVELGCLFCFSCTGELPELFNKCHMQ